VVPHVFPFPNSKKSWLKNSTVIVSGFPSLLYGEGAMFNSQNIVFLVVT
jgi:hypothetical protein